MFTIMDAYRVSLKGTTTYMEEGIGPRFFVVREEAGWIAVDKPAGISTVPSGRPGSDISLLELVSEHVGAKVLTVHRIDRATSGLLLFAKEKGWHRKLCLAFQERRVRKRYLAWVLGKPSAEGVIDQPLKRFGSGRIGPHPEGKPCRTRFRFLETRALDGVPASLIEVEPRTGRRHQIRVHMNHIGHPVLGDPRYGRPRPVGGAPRLLLHANALRFPDEVLKGPLLAAPPPDFPPPSSALDDF